MAYNSTTIIIKNNTNEELVLHSATLKEGKWAPGGYPPQTIFKMSKGEFENIATNNFTGVQGAVSYRLNNRWGTVSVNWDNPLLGNNTYGDSVPGGFEMSRTGGSGNQARVIFTLEENGVFKAEYFEDMEEVQG